MHDKLLNSSIDNTKIFMQIRPTALLLDKELVTDSKTKEDVRVSTVKDDDDEILDLVY